MSEDYVSSANDITDVNVALTRHDDDRLTVRLGWLQNGVRHHAEVEHRMGVTLAQALTFARDAVLLLSYWHTTVSDVYSTLAGEWQGSDVVA